MEWSEVAKTIFYFLGGCSVLWVGKSFDELKNDIKELKNSAIELNRNMAVIAERSEGHERRISRLEEKI